MKENNEMYLPRWSKIKIFFPTDKYMDLAIGRFKIE